MKKCWKINNALDGGEPEILLYGTLSDESWYGDEVTPQAFAADLKALGGKNVTVRINSPGGDVFAAQAIYNQLADYGGKVTARIDGIAASAAVLIVCAADEAIMPDNALLMIHNPAVSLWGSYDSGELTKYSSYLSTVKQAIINAYQKKINLDAKKVAKMMDDEKWMTAQEAKEYGFIDTVTGGPDAQSVAITENLLIVNSVSCDLKQFKNIKDLKRAMKGDKDVGEKENVNESVLEKIKNLLGIPNAPQNTGGATTNQNGTANNSQEEEIRKAVIAALAEERIRNESLDALNDGSHAVSAIINTAKRDKKTVEDVKPFVDALKSQPKERPPQNDAIEKIKNLIIDNMGSGAEQLQAKGQSSAENDGEETLRFNNYLAKCINEKNGRGKDGGTK